jgi:aminopeptidase N
MTTQNPKTIYLKDYTVPNFIIHSVNLHFLLSEDNTQVRSTLTLERHSASQYTGQDLVLHVKCLYSNI